ncbi:MAG: hypothetical protein QF872_07500, partial [Gammaproteobacteria bacterium]|nr:hypothetical protein [Gammaproteobacteria bacterium]
MLSKLLRFLILPILLITLLVYASIPWWVPVVAKYSQLYTDLDIKHLEIGYPWHDHWQIQHLQGHKEASDNLTKVHLENIELNYHLLDLWYGSLPTVSIGKMHFDSQLAQTSLDSVPILLLLPQRWLYQMPESLNIERISGKISTPNTVLGQSFTLAGKFNANPDHAHAIAKITTE